MQHLLNLLAEIKFDIPGQILINMNKYKKPRFHFSCVCSFILKEGLHSDDKTVQD